MACICFILQLPFGNRIYMLSAVLDPNWGARWLEYIASPTNLSELKTRVKGNISVNEHIISLLNRHYVMTYNTI